MNPVGAENLLPLHFDLFPLVDRVMGVDLLIQPKALKNGTSIHYPANLKPQYPRQAIQPGF
jgi:hypothetical protein